MNGSGDDLTIPFCSSDDMHVDSSLFAFLLADLQPCQTSNPLIVLIVLIMILNLL